MQAAYYEQFGQPIEIVALPDPLLPDDGVVIEVKANGICRSDWHGWMGHDPDIVLPHVPGHELSGIVAAVGKDVRRWQIGDRVTVPFVCGCGNCRECHAGYHHICDHQFQPGFTAWGSFAQLVAIRYADLNLVRLPEEIGFVEAASLGCRFTTSFRAVVHQGRPKLGDWMTVYGCGGVGLSAIMIGAAMGAQVIAIDIDDEKLAFAQSLGAAHVINARQTPQVVEQVLDLTNGGAHVSLDALGSQETCVNSIESLRKRGRHVQVGLMVGDAISPQIPMWRLHAKEIELLGSHGMQAHEYRGMLDMILAGKLAPQRLISGTVSLADSAEFLMNMNSFPSVGVTVIDQF